jgi:predicted DNA-binding transcriptional regulator AlpA
VVTVNIEGFLSTAEVAERLDIKAESVYTFARRLDGFPQPAKVGRTLLWPEAEIDAWRAKHPARKRRTTDD